MSDQTEFDWENQKIVYCPTCDGPIFEGDPCWDCSGDDD